MYNFISKLKRVFFMLDNLNPDKIEQLQRIYGKVIVGRMLTPKEKQDHDNALLEALEYQDYLTKKAALDFIAVQRETDQSNTIAALSDAQRKLEEERAEHFQNYQKAKAQADAEGKPPINIIDFDKIKFDQLFPKIASTLNSDQKDQLLQYEKTKDIHTFRQLVSTCSETQLDAVNELIHAKRQYEIFSQLPKQLNVGNFTMDASKLRPTPTPTTAGRILKLAPSLIDVSDKKEVDEEAKVKEAKVKRLQDFAQYHMASVPVKVELGILQQICKANNIEYCSPMMVRDFARIFKDSLNNILTTDRSLANEEREAITNQSIYHFVLDHFKTSSYNLPKPMPRGYNNDSY